MREDKSRRSVVAGVDGSECSLQAVRWAAEEATRRRPLRLVAAHAWPSGRLVGDPGLDVDYAAVLREAVLGHLAATADAARQVMAGWRSGRARTEEPPMRATSVLTPPVDERAFPDPGRAADRASSAGYRDVGSSRR